MVKKALKQCLGFAAFLLFYLLRPNLPKTRGKINLPGLQYPVRIMRDPRSVPLIQAQTRQDLFFALGFTHAQERLWQMEILRRIASGTLSEIIGEATLPIDRFMRRVGLRRSVEEQYYLLPRRIRKDLAAYSNGVNAFIARNPWWRTPSEFLLLKIKPQPWIPQDSCCIMKLVAFGLAPNWDTQIVRTWLIERLGPELAAQLEPKYVDPEILASPLGIKGPELLSEYADISSWLSTAAASNVWAVDGTKSSSGRPLLANDIHVPAGFPSFGYETALNAPGINACGISVPGLPAFIAGKNRFFAWGVSAGLINQQDLFVEHLNPQNPLTYRSQNNWRTGKIVCEYIIVRDREEPVREEVLITHHGPVISPLIEGEEKVLALKSAVLEQEVPFVSAANIMVACNMRQFKRALKRWTAPGLNFVYADCAGNIGWQIAGAIPRRCERSGLIPGRGWEEDDNWQGYLPFEELPCAWNPSSHLVAAANNRPIAGKSISGEWADSYRIARISELLSGTATLSVIDFENMQNDTYSHAARELLLQVLPVLLKHQEHHWAARELARWDHNVTKDSRAAALFEVFGFRLYYNIFYEKLGDDINYYLGKGVHAATHINGLAYRSASHLVRILSSLPPDWFSEGRSKENVFIQSWNETIEYLRKNLGKNKKHWRWGRLHAVTFPHAMGGVPVLGRLLNIGPFPIPGDVNTIPQASYDPMEPFRCKASTVLWRHIVDLADPSDAETVLVPGQSGHRRSKHANDQISAWRSGNYFPSFLEETENMHQLQLIPEIKMPPLNEGGF